jgi:transposase
MKKDTRDGSGLTVGVDLGDRWSRYCVLDAQGEILEEDTIASTGKAFRKLFGKRPAARVVIEVGTHSPWVQRLLRELGHETITANPRYVRLIYGSRNKNACSAKHPDRVVPEAAATSHESFRAGNTIVVSAPRWAAAHSAACIDSLGT